MNGAVKSYRTCMETENFSSNNKGLLAYLERYHFKLRTIVLFRYGLFILCGLFCLGCINKSQDNKLIARKNSVDGPCVGTENSWPNNKRGRVYSEIQSYVSYLPLFSLVGPCLSSVVLLVLAGKRIIG